ncbi:DUF4936 family protein [Pelomonas sp. SE-A7]|uniref:DUF4936 family protein n=1 Tax=Pelomonas sp. SE-A7 TaxID=3054953 RepID=UPI00259CBD0E|nr:DUF4936 family protein [Pelomonas sp. SE-A7]MDM4765163.1 DUF4936 family protein [Pelomonas sp. SE-A7]
MAEELYVYYKLRPEAASAARAAFELARASAPVRLLQRPGSDGLLTWMEIYTETQLHCEPRIAAALGPFVLGDRHAEWFEPLSG